MRGVGGEGGAGQGEGGRGGDGEAAWFGDVGFGGRVEVYPLAGDELGLAC
jgi:hypothetical protein